jgi:hypothetical protein
MSAFLLGLFRLIRRDCWFWIALAGLWFAVHPDTVVRVGGAPTNAGTISARKHIFRPPQESNPTVRSAPSNWRSPAGYWGVSCWFD